jgi:hypothetical protein
VSVDAPRLSCYLVEWYRPAVTAGPLGDTAARLEQGAATVRHEGASVQLLMTLAVPADEVLFVSSPRTRQSLFRRPVVGRVCPPNGSPTPRMCGSRANRRESPDASPAVLGRFED